MSDNPPTTPWTPPFDPLPKRSDPKVARHNNKPFTNAAPFVHPSEYEAVSNFLVGLRDKTKGENK